MKCAGQVIPVVLFAYARPLHLARALASLRENQVPMVEVFADGAKGSSDRERVEEVRAMLRRIDWCEVRLRQRAENLGLGRNVLAGVTEIASRHEGFVVWEDDLVCVPGTYDWLCAALDRYRTDARVMSVTGWTHPRVTPNDVGNAPYFDARAESWSWGSWSRAWRGMESETAVAKMAALRARGIPADVVGGDLPAQGQAEQERNLWAARWLFHHLLHGGLCLRPPRSLVDHAGFDAAATNAPAASGWNHATLDSAPPPTSSFPAVREHSECRALWRRACPSGWRAWMARAAAVVQRRFH